VKATKKNIKKTKVIVHYDCGFGNSLFIRGEGISTLSWDKGAAMKNISHNLWSWESQRPLSSMEFKVLINDKEFERGGNHAVCYGQKIEITPQF